MVEAGLLPYVGVVVATSAAAWAIVSFGLLRRRNPVAWQGGPSPIGAGMGVPVADPPVADPAIARRIAELIPPSSEPDRFADADDRAGRDGPEAPGSPDGPPDRGPDHVGIPEPATSDPHLGFSDQFEYLLTDGSDETVDGAVDAEVDAGGVHAALPWPAAAAESLGWPEEDPGVARPLLDAAASSEPTATIDRESLARLLTDPLTGLGTAVAWELWVADEDPRERRYGRPTTIVLAELDGLDAVVALHGPGVAERAAAMIGTAFRANVRTSDRAAVVGPGLYAVLLTETDEVRAVNFVERVRATCEEWLAANAAGVTIALGWASPQGDGLGGARARAQERLARDRG